MNINNKRIIKNTVALCLRMLVTVAIGIYTSRVILYSLGIVDYGIYNVIGGIVSLFSFFNTSMIDATQRYLNYYIGKGDFKKVNDVFSTSLTIFTLLAIVVFVLCETVGLYLMYYKLTIPENRITAAFWILQFSSFSSLINISSTPYNALIISYEKMTTFAYVSIFQSISILFISLGINYMIIDKLIIYGFLIMIVHLLIRLFYRYYCMKFFHDIKNKYYISKDMFKELLSFSGWTLSSTFAYITYNQGINIMMNMFYGPAVNAAQALANQINGNLTMFSSNFTIASKPQITKYYAEGQLLEMEKLIYLSSKLSFLIFLTISIPFFLYGDYLLSLWLKEVPKYTYDFLQMLLIINLVGTLTQPIITAVHATGKIKGFQIMITIISMLILPIAYFVNKYTLNPIFTYYILLLMVIIMQLGRLYYLNRLLKFSLIDYFGNIISKLIIVSLLSLFLMKNIRIFLDNNLYGLFFICFCSFIIVPILSFFIALNRNDRHNVINFITNIISKNRK